MTKREGPLALAITDLAVWAVERGVSASQSHDIDTSRFRKMTRAQSVHRRPAYLWRNHSGRRDRATKARALERLEAGGCYLCGGQVEEVLARLGSTLCHDCRDGLAHRPARAGI